MRLAGEVPVPDRRVQRDAVSPSKINFQSVGVSVRTTSLPAAATAFVGYGRELNRHVDLTPSCSWSGMALDELVAEDDLGFHGMSPPRSMLQSMVYVLLCSFS